ncbi:Lysine/ornithine decarboxylase [Legionella beliardensis]|uniref:Carboxynorspermidine/carboxyspermidine decarboxylase n=1 Tax=Legionella beliardensis TaxID=91822 RepID=A0A378I1B1_9GAMM|nr:carboxynorspermidine decarboxylase [Legionella beliardensis]STX28521.1 Lysine/ornithine decarboxylase [Legionella beliardensis]
MKTPFYVIDIAKLLANLEIIEKIKEKSGAKFLFALKTFSVWALFDIINKYMDGFTSSSPYEVKLGYDKFGGEGISYSVAYSDDDFKQVIDYADKIIFNSASQVKYFRKQVNKQISGIRINPGYSFSPHDISNTCRPYCRLGESNINHIEAILDDISGFMFHIHCENNNYKKFDESLCLIENKYGHLFHRVDWIDLGGGISFTNPDYPIYQFAERLKEFITKYQVQVYLEPGQAVLNQVASLETTVVDIIENERKIAILDCSADAHMPEILSFPIPAQVEPNEGPYTYILAGNSCLAGDIFGEFNFKEELKPGSRVSFKDTGSYTIVKQNWFNGLRMPSIAIKQPNGHIELIKTFNYEDFLNSQS